MNSTLKMISFLLSLFLLHQTATAQEDSIIIKRKGLEGLSISIGNNGIKITDKYHKPKHHKLHNTMHFDFGFHNVIDNTDYGQSQLGIFKSDNSGRLLNSNDLKLNTGKSINFNFWPLWFSQDLAKHNLQFESGLGFQFFNYRFDSKVVHADQNGFFFASPNEHYYFYEVTNPSELEGKAKNKLGVSYISVPFMIRINSNKSKDDNRFTFAAGTILSYKLKSWSKFYGEKNAGDYDIKDYMTQLTAEIGITGIIKFYGTYAMQPMYKSSFMNRTPFAIGIRL